MFWGERGSGMELRHDQLSQLRKHVVRVSPSPPSAGVPYSPCSRHPAPKGGTPSPRAQGGFGGGERWQAQPVPPRRLPSSPCCASQTTGASVPSLSFYFHCHKVPGFCFLFVCLSVCLEPVGLLGLLLNSSQDKAAGHASRDAGTDAQTGFTFTNEALCWSCCFSAQGSAAARGRARGRTSKEREGSGVFLQHRVLCGPPRPRWGPALRGEPRAAAVHRGLAAPSFTPKLTTNLLPLASPKPWQKEGCGWPPKCPRPPHFTWGPSG